MKLHEEVPVAEFITFILCVVVHFMFLQIRDNLTHNSRVTALNRACQVKRSITREIKTTDNNDKPRLLP